MRSDIRRGGTFPDFELSDHARATRTLSEIQGEDPLILTLARGHYCPKEHQQHLELAAFYRATGRRRALPRMGQAREAGLIRPTADARARFLPASR